MKQHVVEAMEKKWKLPEDVIEKPKEDFLSTEEPDDIHIADKLADKNTSLKRKMKLIEQELGKRPAS